MFFGDTFRQIVAYCTNPTKYKIADTTNGGDLLLERESKIKTKRVGSRQTPRLRTVLANLMSEPSRLMDCGTESELRTVFVAIRNIYILPLFNCS